MTKVFSEMDPADIAKHPDIIKQALEDVSSLDVLVCGSCHQPFHHIEAFTEHKAKKCTKEDKLKKYKDVKHESKVWAFTLWKACQKKADEDQNGNSWELYQTWMNLEESVKETWIVAGKTIQSFARMGQGQLQEVPVKIIKQVGDQPKGGNELTPITRPVSKRNIVLSGGKKSESEQDGDTATDDDFSPQPRLPTTGLRQVARKPAPRPAISRPNTQLNSKNVVRQAMRTMGANETEEHMVEKILAKKFNPRRRTYEYLVKWLNFSHDQNTWEPQVHLEKCTALLQSFENQLAYQKEQRAAAAKAAEENKVANSENQPMLKRKTEDTDADAEADDEQPARKLVRNDAVNQALQRAGQSGTVKIVSMNRGGGGAAAGTASVQKATVVNGAATPKGEKNSAEVVITQVKDKPTGVMRKPGVTNTTPPSKKEAQVHVVTRGEGVSSGIVRVTAASQANKMMPKLVPRVTQARQTPVKANVVVSRASTAPTIQRQPVLRQVSPQQPTTIVRNQTIIRRSAPQQQATQVTPQGRTVVQRVVQKNTPSPKVATSEAKIMSLSRQGDLKIVRKGKGKSESGDDVEIVYTTAGQEASSSPEPTYTLCPMTGELKKPGGGTVMKSSSSKKEVQKVEEHEEKKESGTVTAIQTEDGQIQQIITNEDGSPVLVTGEDGTIYQVAGKNAEGQTLLIAQGADGEQQCVYVAAEDGDEGLLGTDASQETEGEQQIVLKDDSAGGTDATQQLVISTDGDSQDGNITAELVQADMPSPGGTRRVVLMLPDGNLMMTEVKF